MKAGFDIRTIITAAVIIPTLTYGTVQLAKLWWRLTARALRLVTAEAIGEVVRPRFDRVEHKLDTLTDENNRSHGEVSGRLDQVSGRLDQHETRLDSIDARLSHLESRRRADRPDDGEPL